MDTLHRSARYAVTLVLAASAMAPSVWAAVPDGAAQAAATRAPQAEQVVPAAAAPRTASYYPAALPVFLAAAPHTELADRPLAPSAPPSIAKTASITQTYYQSGATFTYTLVFTIPASTTITNAALVDSLPDNNPNTEPDFRYVAGSSVGPVPGPGTPPIGTITPTVDATGHVVTWSLGSLANPTGAPYRYSMLYRANLIGGDDRVEVGTNDAVLSHSVGSVSASTDVVVQRGRPAVAQSAQSAIDSTPPIDLLRAGAVVTFSVYATGTLGYSASHDVVISDTLPDWLTYSGVVGSTPPPDAIAVAGGRQTLGWRYAALGPGQSIAPLTFRATVTSSVAAGRDNTNDLRAEWRDLPEDPSTSAVNNSLQLRTANVLVLKTEVDALSPQARVVIDEPITYTILVSIPAGTTVYSPAHVFDNALADGLNFGGEVSHAGYTGPGVVGPGGGGATLITWTLTNTLAAASDLTMTFVFTAYSDGALIGGPIPRGTTLNNTANARWNVGAGTSGLNNPIVPQSSVGVQFARPDIQPNKDATPSSVISAGGEVVQYRITNLKNGTSIGDPTATDAFDVIVTDTLPAGFGFVAAAPPPMGVFTLGNTVVLTWGVAPTLPVGYTYDPPGITTTNTTIYVTATAPLALADPTYTNTVAVQYSDRPGQAPGKQTYIFARTKTLSVNFVETKAVAPTGSLRIGDVLTYVVTDSVPAGATMYWPRHVDDLPSGVHFVSGTMALTGTTFVSSSIPLTVPVGAPERLLWWTASISNAFGTAPLVVTSSFQARVTGIDVSGGAVFSGTGAFRGASGINNMSRIDWSSQDVSGTLDVFRQSNSAGSQVVQPFLADSPLAKLFGGSTSGSTTIGAGDVVTFHVVVTNTGLAAAYDVVISDALPAGMQLTAFAGTGRTFSGAVFTPTFTSAPALGSTGAVGWIVDAIEAGDGNSTAPSTVFTLTYSAQASAGIGAGATLINSAVLADYSSLPGSDPFERSYGFLLGPARAVTLTTPSAAISKSVNLTGANWLDVITYTLSVPQPAINATLYNVAVTDTVPAQITVLGVQASGGVGAQVGFSGSVVTASATSIGPQARMVVTVTGQIDVGASGSKVNSALLTWSDASAGGQVHSAASNPVTTTILLPELGLVKSGPPTVRPGQVFTYALSYSNTGTSVASAVSVQDDLPNAVVFVTATAPAGTSLILQPDPLQWNAGAMPAGQGGTIVVTVSLPVTTPLGTLLVNRADISTTTPGDSPSNNASIITTTVAASVLSIAKSAVPSPAEAGQPIAYTLHVTNTGNAATSGLVVTDVVPANTAFGSASPGGIQAGGRVTWTLAALAPSASTSVTFTAIVASPLVSGTMITNSDYAARADNALGTVLGPPVAVVAHSRPRLVVSKAGPAIVLLGASVRYTVVVTNSGATDAQGTTLVDNLPNELVFASFSASGTVTQTAGPDPLGFDLGALAPGQSRTLLITATAPLTLTPGSLLTNTATVATTTPGEDASDNTAQHVATVSGVALNIRKTADVSSAAPGGTIRYTIEYSNTGSAVATGVAVTDTYDANVTFVSASPPPSIGNNVWNSPGTLNPGERRVIAITVTLAPALPNGTSISNVAQVGASGAAPAQSSVVVGVVSSAVLTIDKTGHGAAMPGGTIVYRLDYANVGNAPAANARITETYPAGTTFVAASPAPSIGNNVWNLGTLTPPVSGAIVVTLSVGSGVPNGTLLTNTVALASDQTGPVGDSFRTKVGPVFLPLVMRNFAAQPNLVVQSIVVSPPAPAALQPAVISVTIVNLGPVAAPPGFWTDLYIDPLSVPGPGQPWNEIAPVGKAWILRTPLGPGQSITLDTTMPDDPANPGAVYSNWPGFFAAAGAHTLYAQVDSFGGGSGLVVELNELDNLFGPVTVIVSAGASIPAGAEWPLLPLDVRPTPAP